MANGRDKFLDIHIIIESDLPDLFCIDEAHAGPTALAGFPTFRHLIKRVTAPSRTSKSTKADRAIMAMVLTLSFWFLFPKFAVIGRFPALGVGPLPSSPPYGGEEGSPGNIVFISQQSENDMISNQVNRLI